MKYLSDDDQELTMKWTCPLKATLEKLHKEIVDQVKDQDNQYVDKLLEDAIINGGTK